MTGQRAEHGASTDTGVPLTAAQERTLAEVRAAGVKVYNGRKRRTIEALERAGVVAVDWDVRFHSKGNGLEVTSLITVRPAVPPAPRGD